MRALRRRDFAVHQVAHERPAACRLRPTPPRAARALRTCGTARPRPSGKAAQRRERVVRHQPRPHQVPQRLQDGVDLPPAGRGVEVGEEARPPLRQMVADRPVEVALGTLGGQVEMEERKLATEVEGDSAVPRSQGPPPRPHHLPFEHQLVESGAGLRHPGGEDVSFQHRGRDLGSLEAGHRLQQRAPAPGSGTHPVPGGQEATDGRRIHRFDLSSQLGQ